MPKPSFAAQLGTTSVVEQHHQRDCADNKNQQLRNPAGITIWLSTCTSTPRAYESAVARAKYGVRAKRRAKLAWAVDPQ